MPCLPSRVVLQQIQTKVLQVSDVSTAAGTAIPVRFLPECSASATPSRGRSQHCSQVQVDYCHSLLAENNEGGIHSLSTALQVSVLALQYHNSIVHKIDTSLCAGDFQQLMKLANTKEIGDLFTGEVDSH